MFWLIILSIPAFAYYCILSEAMGDLIFPEDAPVRHRKYDSANNKFYWE